MASSIHIVVIDDHPASLELLTVVLSHEDVIIHTATDPRKGLELVRRVHPRLVVTDLMMPEMTGLEVLQQIVAFDPTIDVVLLTGHYTAETAMAAIRLGAADYLPKPVNIGEVRHRIGQLIEGAQRRLSRAAGSGEPSDFEFEGMLARSHSMWTLFSTIERIAPHYRSVSIVGPTGSGKDLVARALHHRSGVRGRFVVLNCSAMSETLFESEMFGHVRGAFTGADRDKVGLFEHANAGTIFLDEIGDMPLGLQAKLLRAIQNQEILPVGSLTPRSVDVRVVAATHQDLRAAVAQGRFREDLFYRLSMVELYVPALVERPGDITLLAKSMVQKFAAEFGKAIDGITPRALVVLEGYSWPGNVRELEHVIGRACMLTGGRQIDVADLPEQLLKPPTAAQKNPWVGGSRLAEQEKRAVEEALLKSGGNQSEAARLLGIGRDALRYKMRKNGLLE